MRLSAAFCHSAFLKTARGFIVLCALLGANAARADFDSYYAPPTQVRAGLQLSYSESFSQDYRNLNQNPLARFETATAGFHFDRSKNILKNLRISFTAGSVSSPDKDYTWILINTSGLDVNTYEEISISSTQPVTLDKDNKAVMDGLLTLRGTTAPVKMNIRLNFVQDNNFITGKLRGEKGTVGLTLETNFACADFGMKPVDNDNKSRGDLGTLKMELRALRQ